MNYLIDGVLPSAGFGVMSAPSGFGKSATALDLALSVASGCPWHGLAVKAGKAVYVLAEGSAGFRHRIRAALSDRGSDGRDLPLLVTETPPELLNRGDVESFAESVLVAGGADFLVVDALFSATDGRDSDDDQRTVVANIRALCQRTGAFVLLLDAEPRLPIVAAAADVELAITRTGATHVLRVERLAGGTMPLAKAVFHMVSVSLDSLTDTSRVMTRPA